jgi:hypothetical protein
VLLVFLFIVTPYTSILKEICGSEKMGTRMHGIDFYWICNDTRCYEWFGAMLRDVERQLRERKIDLRLKIYLTRWANEVIPSIVQNHVHDRDLFTGLESKTQYGRPNFSLEFQSLVHEHERGARRQSIGVFVCGPTTLTRELARLCREFNARKRNGGNVRFYLNKENF